MRSEAVLPAELTFGPDYRVTGELARNGPVLTVSATDVRDGASVVIKSSGAAEIPHVSLMRLEHDVEALRAIDSPALAAPRELGRRAGTVFLVTPYVNGVSLEARLAADEQLEVDDVLAIAEAVLSALCEAHAADVLHRNVKPSNVIVPDGSPIGAATLVGFGLARSIAAEALEPAELLAAARYTSPELAGLLTNVVDERSDLYSVGVLLFECLAGRPPFVADTVGDLLRLHLTSKPRNVRDMAPATPRALDELVTRLLGKDPRDRYQSAQAALHDVRELRRIRSEGVEDPVLVLGRRDLRHTLLEPAFVGRELELAILDEQLAAALRGEGSLVIVEAESGGGKTRLLTELAHRSAAAGAWVLRGQGVDQAAPRPLHMLAGIAQEIVAQASLDPEVADRLQGSLGDHQASVCAALPDLGEVLETTPGADPGPELFAETRSLDALSALLDALGRPGRPAVVILDDCQWADGMSAKLLHHWQAHAAAHRHVLVVAGFRPEEVAEDHPLRHAVPSAALPLSPLADDEVALLTESMAGELPGDARDAVLRLSEGNPFMASAVLHGLVESGALVAESSGWTIDPVAMDRAQSSREAASLLATRIELLPVASRELLAVAAVLGKAFDLDLAVQLANLPARDAFGAIEDARRRRLVWAMTGESSYMFVHDKVREAVLSLVPASERARLHLRAAVAIERDSPDALFELAYHFDAAGEHARAFPHALAAAAQARSRHAPEVAERQYRIAEKGADEADAASRRTLAEGLGDVLMLQGRYELAEREFAAAKQLAQDPVSEAMIEGKVGELCFKRGDVISASAALERALRLLDEPVPRRQLGFLLRFILEALVQLAHTLAPGMFIGRRPYEGAERDRLCARLYSRLAHVYWFQRGRLPTGWSHLRGMNLAERYPPTRELAQAYSEHAPVMTMIPYFKRGIAYAERSLEIRREHHDLWGEGQSLHFYGVALYGASRFEECIECCSEAVRLLAQTGDRWELNTARWHIAFAHYRRGELAQAAAVARSVHRAGLEIGDTQASGISLGAWSKATGGDVPVELLERELARPLDDVHTRAELLQASAVRLIGAGRPIEAVAALSQAWRLVRQKGLRQEYVSPILPWLATALRQQAERTSLAAHRRRRSLNRRARITARRAVRLARRYRNNLPHALRELALAEVFRGRSRRARRLFDRSLQEAEAQGARFEYIQTLMSRATVGSTLGWPGAAEELARTEQEFLRIGARPIQQLGGQPNFAGVLEPTSLSLADRFDALLDAGRRIASALSREAVFAEARVAALRLLRGERAFVLAIPEGGTLEDVSVVSGAKGGEVEESCRSVAIQVLLTGEPWVFSREADGIDQLDAQVASSGVRSAVCVPVFVRGRAAACVYVEHRAISGLFGEEDRRLGLFIATLAGAALENAEGFHAAEGLASSLKKRTFQLEESNQRLDVSVKELKAAYDRERQTASQLNHMAFHDALTGLANRVLFTETVEHAARRARRGHSTVAVLFMDLDDFKTVNDSLGHAIGDELLIAVAQRIRSCLRNADLAARLSGDEFAIVLEDLASSEDAALGATRVLSALQPPFNLAGKELFVRASIGIALGPTGEESGQATELLRNADVAMYVAKDERKGGYAFFLPGMHRGLLQRLELRADLERALGQGDFTIHYQPIVVLESGEVDGIEALVRWQHPERGLIRPGDFVPLAEETGLLRALGHWVLCEACRQARRWREQLPDGEGLTISVNLSPSELHEPGLVDQVSEALRDSGLEPASLILEITESVFMQDTDATIDRLVALKRLGVGLALDDFGTGYSSLGYLRRFPLDRIKVAKQFVDDVAKPAGESSLARAIVTLGDTFELETVAEGIERGEQLSQLREIGCRLGQGNLFCEPLAAPEVTAFLQGRTVRSVPERWSKVGLALPKRHRRSRKL